MTDDQPDPAVPTDAQRQAAADRFFSWWENNYEQLLRYARGFTLVRRGSREEADYVHAVAIGFRADLQTAPTVAKLAERLASYQKTAYFRTAMKNRHTDEFRRKDGPSSPSLDPAKEKMLSETSHDPFDELLDQLVSQTLVGEIVDLLCERGQEQPRPLTHWTPRQAQLYRRADARGDQSRLAEEIGVDRATITRDIQAARRTVLSVLYLAGVLAPTGTLEERPEISDHLDSHDETNSDQALTNNERALLKAGAVSMPSTPGGQRADAGHAAVYYPNLLRPAVRRKLRDELASGQYPRDEYINDIRQTLHAAEGRHAERVQGTGAVANCVTGCTPHNPQPNRVIWEL